jgi:hypothetical protein
MRMPAHAHILTVVTLPSPPFRLLQGNVQGLKAAAATLLLSSDAGMGPAGSILSLAKDALDSIMKM